MTAKPYQRYEFALVDPEGKTLHVYIEPFVRSDYDVRLLGSSAIEDDGRQVPGQLGRGDDPLQGVLGQPAG